MAENKEEGWLRSFVKDYKDVLLLIGVLVAALTSTGNLAIDADQPTETSNRQVIERLDSIESRLQQLETEAVLMNAQVQSLAKWQAEVMNIFSGRSNFMNCAKTQIEANRAAATAERVCSLEIPR